MISMATFLFSCKSSYEGELWNIPLKCLTINQLIDFGNNCIFNLCFKTFSPLFNQNRQLMKPKPNQHQKQWLLWCTLLRKEYRHKLNLIKSSIPFFRSKITNNSLTSGWKIQLLSVRVTDYIFIQFRHPWTLTRRGNTKRCARRNSYGGNLRKYDWVDGKNGYQITWRRVTIRWYI